MLNLKKPFFSKIRFVVDASRYKLFDYRGHSEQSKLQILESDLLRVVRKLDATFNTPVGSRNGSPLIPSHAEAHSNFEAPALALELFEIDD